MTRMLVVAGVLAGLVVLPSMAFETLNRSWQGAVWNGSQRSAISAWENRGWRFKRFIDDTALLTGQYAGYNAEIYLPSGLLTEFNVTVDSQKNKTSAAIWSDLARLFSEKYGNSETMWFRPFNSNRPWEAIEDGNQKAVASDFVSTKVDVRAVWEDGPIQAELYTSSPTNFPGRYTAITYRHTVFDALKHEKSQDSRRADV